MALKGRLTKEEFEKLGDPLKEHYKAAGNDYVLDAEGVEDVTGLKTAYDKTRKELADVKDLVKKFEGVDPEKYRDLVAKQQELEDKEKEQRGEWETLKADMSRKHQQELDGERKKTEAANKKAEDTYRMYTGEMIEREAIAAIASAKGVPELLMPLIRSRVKVVEDNGKLVVRVFKPDGEIMGGKNGNPASIGDLLEEMKNSEVFGRAFEGTGSSGGGAPVGSRAGQNGNTIFLTREQAKDPSIYRAAKDRAAKEGKSIQIEEMKTPGAAA